MVRPSTLSRVVRRSIYSSSSTAAPTSSSPPRRRATLPRATLLRRPARPLPLRAVRSHRRQTRALRPTTASQAPKSCPPVPPVRTPSRRQQGEEEPSAFRPSSRLPWVFIPTNFPQRASRSTPSRYQASASLFTNKTNRRVPTADRDESVSFSLVRVNRHDPCASRRGNFSAGSVCATSAC